MKKVLKRKNREKKTLQLYGCTKCTGTNCSGCGVSTAADYLNVMSYHGSVLIAAQKT